MQWCQTHWDKLREFVEAKGLSKFGAQTAEACHAEMVNQIEGAEPSFDPLIGSMWNITNHVLEHAGLRAMEGCPCCLVASESSEDIPLQWMEDCTESARKYAIEKGWVQLQ